MTEMALKDFKKIGKWKDTKNRHGYDKASLGILMSDAGVKKIQDKFNNINIADFNLYFVKQPKARQFAETGQVSEEDLNKMLGLEVGKDIARSNDDITIIFTNNAAAERIPLTYWTIAHRIGHAFAATMRRKYRSPYRDYIKRIDNILSGIFEDCYGYNGENIELGRGSNAITRNFVESIGKFRSARTKQLPRTFEFIFECFAQWLLSNGNLSFNNFPKTINTSNKQVFGRNVSRVLYLKDQDYAEDYKQQLIWALEELFEFLVNEHIDTISIM
jgi:hypothetical protein